MPANSVVVQKNNYGTKTVMETIGTVAAVIQLVRLAKDIIVSKLYDLIKDIPGWFRNWKSGLAALKEILRHTRT